MQSQPTESDAQGIASAASTSMPHLTDPRLRYRLERIVECMSKAPGQSILQSSADWAEGKAAYRFLGLLG